MRDLPAIRLKGVSEAKVWSSAKLQRRLANMRESGPAAAFHVRYVDGAHSAKVDTGFAKRMRVISMSGTLSLSSAKQEAGLSSNDGRGSSLLPARSDGFDDVDGGPDAAFYIQMGVIQQVSIWSRF